MSVIYRTVQGLLKLRKKLYQLLLIMVVIAVADTQNNSPPQTSTDHSLNILGAQLIIQTIQILSGFVTYLYGDLPVIGRYVCQSTMEALINIIIHVIWNYVLMPNVAPTLADRHQFEYEMNLNLILYSRYISIIFSILFAIVRLFCPNNVEVIDTINIAICVICDYVRMIYDISEMPKIVYVTYPANFPQFIILLVQLLSLILVYNCQGIIKCVVAYITVVIVIMCVIYARRNVQMQHDESVIPETANTTDRQTVIGGLLSVFIAYRGQVYLEVVVAVINVIYDICNVLRTRYNTDVL